jgi:AraC-like DNA-binding protein
MNYVEEIVSNKILKRDVLCYWYMSGYINSTAGINSRYLPKGQNILVFNFGDSIEQLNLSQNNDFKSPFFIVPAIKSSTIINQKGRIDLFGISFIGEGLYKLIQQPVSKLISEFPNTLKGEYEELFSDLSECNFLDKVKIVEKFLLENLNQKIESPVFQKAIKVIHEHKGVIKVFEITDKVHVSERQLQRLFKTRLGISPKDYCKIIRVNNYLEFIISKNKTVDWMELVVEYDYHDQPHLINEVKSISKLSPKNLLSFRDTLYHRYLGA